MLINYYINDEGTLFIYDGNALIVEISDCANSTEEEIEAMIAEEVENSDYLREKYGEAAVVEWLNNFKEETE